MSSAEETAVFVCGLATPLPGVVAAASEGLAWKTTVTEAPGARSVTLFQVSWSPPALETMAGLAVPPGVRTEVPAMYDQFGGRVSFTSTLLATATCEVLVTTTRQVNGWLIWALAMSGLPGAPVVLTRDSLGKSGVSVTVSLGPLYSR